MVSVLPNGAEALALRDACLFILASILQNWIVGDDNASLIYVSVSELENPLGSCCGSLDIISFIYQTWLRCAMDA